ncbi:conjugal transfer protein TraG N-terminal domain-containing protein [Pseudomonas koreensis]|uniref:Conjugal transfer protein TraG N-terminal domain-containing protein n=1 Tax=Pseudomonas koreensis TaxID=198620 RepID=A0A9X2XEM6_9PSED|nr:conjugal transfer protein TraG N-terminal domain-containing protein [Pseudomonas koreensis]MCU7247303.1 conjugal transfer protein TraG N-terminal domain-containing protein [Pseudomonas koreensis]
MTLYTNDYLEYYLTLVGWIVSNGIWEMLVASGVFALPFLAIIIQEWLKARSEGADEGNKGVLSSLRIENRVWVAIGVIMFAGIPFIDVDLDTIEFNTTRSKQCQVDVAIPQDTRWSNTFTTLNNQSAKVPVWWFFMHTLSKALAGGATAAIPCGTDLRQIRIDIDTARIDDPVLAQEVADFSHDCYGPARAKLFMNRPTLNDALLDDINWVGSNHLVNTSGYYDTYHSKTPRAQWPFNSVRDAGLTQVPAGGGYPTCKQWWTDASYGLRTRLLRQVEPDLLFRLTKWARFLNQREAEDAVVRSIASPRQQSLKQGQVYASYAGQIEMTASNATARAASDLGLTIGSLGYFPAMDVVRQALPMVLSFLKMALTICIPLILVVGTYDLKSLVTISCVQFALFFVDFWFQLARWLDSTILDALYGWNSPHSNFNVLLGINNSFGDMLLNYVMGAMFVVLPVFWVGSLSWIGINAGNAIRGLGEATIDAKGAGRTGVAHIKGGAK